MLRPDLNLLPTAYRRGLLSPQQLALLIALVVGVVLLVPVYGLASGSRSETAELREERDTVSAQAEAVYLKQQRLTQLQEESAKYEVVLSQRGLLSVQFHLVTTGVVISGVSVDDVTIGDGSISLSGVADDVQAVFDYRAALSQREEFASVDLSQISYTSEVGERSFVIDIDLK